jgi:hypothetical protein
LLEWPGKVRVLDDAERFITPFMKMLLGRDIRVVGARVTDEQDLVLVKHVTCHDRDLMDDLPATRDDSMLFRETKDVDWPFELGDDACLAMLERGSHDRHFRSSRLGGFKLATSISIGIIHLVDPIDEPV